MKLNKNYSCDGCIHKYLTKEQSLAIVLEHKPKTKVSIPSNEK